ncbi:MAG: electron transport complex subunit E [Candidatus Hadarchaeales archaeon]
MKVQEFTKGILRKNPVLGLILGLCPVLAITTKVENALGMSVAFTFVIVLSNLLISLLKRFIPRDVRIPTFIVIIASFVTIVEMLIHGYSPPLYEQLGIFLPLITVNCIVLGRAEAFASKRPVSETLLDTLGMSVGFSLSIIVISSLRELFGTGKIVVFGHQLVPGLLSSPATGMILPPGAFLVMGILLAVMKKARVV